MSIPTILAKAPYTAVAKAARTSVWQNLGVMETYGALQPMAQTMQMG